MTTRKPPHSTQERQNATSPGLADLWATYGWVRRSRDRREPLIQVEDASGAWHAARIGPGVLCQQATAQVETPAIQTMAWDHGVHLVNCPTCLERIDTEAAA